jgi:hypothetical protein
MGAFAVAFGCLAGGYLFGRWQEGKSNAVVGWFIEIAGLLFNCLVVAGILALIWWGNAHG